MGRQKAKWRADNPSRACSGKVKHKTEEDAKESMESAVAKVVYIGGVGINGIPRVYQCRRCNFWHWGHSRRYM